MITTKALATFANANDYMYANTYSTANCICTPEDRESVATAILNSNTPIALSGDTLTEITEHYPEMAGEIANGCTIYAAEEYDGATLKTTHYIAYYD